jgi:hypothetical protein
VVPGEAGISKVQPPLSSQPHRQRRLVLAILDCIADKVNSSNAHWNASWIIHAIRKDWKYSSRIAPDQSEYS